MNRRAVFGLVSSFIFYFLLASCQSQPEQANEPSVGIGYIGPLTLNLRKDLGTRSAPAGSVKHGDRVDILEIRRRFIRVRTVDGTIGWMDANQLLSAQQMDQLQQLAEGATKLPLLGAATTLDALNMHTEPNRQSPSFHQIAEGGAVDVVGHRFAPRTQPNPTPTVSEPRRAKATKKKKQTKAVLIDLPTPPPPGLPKNWQDLSRPRISDLPGYVAPEAPPPPPLDEWNLVRTKDGKAGWVLSRMLYMSIPDEVAQYAEGHRITSYLAIGDITDDGNLKHIWLWTTAASGFKSADFDSFRVFVWSLKHHRYETAYIERNIAGFFPVQLEPPTSQDEKCFSVILQEKNGTLAKRIYAFNGYRVRMVSKTPMDHAPELPSLETTKAPVNAAPLLPEISWWKRVSNLPKRWFQR